MIELRLTESSGQWPVVSSAIGFSVEGLVWADRVCLARTVTDESGRKRIAVVEDRDRVLALLSVATGRQVEPAALLHVEAAAKLWEQGEKALANLRLVFADLVRLDDPGDYDRMVLAEYALDAGVAPAR